ncbi:hypothetical protein V5O48_019688 [Marasmius crinis-equi]|uniref:Uncharacterized protein n=1 Tax=Marasmius crinis-equi TaxID=585013 RepID=A0ABR3EHP8_9AGAR
MVMRAGTETQLLALAASSEVDICFARPGIISSWQSVPKAFLSFAAWVIPGAPIVSLEQMGAACLQQVVSEKGFEKEILENEDLVRVGKGALEGKEQEQE